MIWSKNIVLLHHHSKTGVKMKNKLTLSFILLLATIYFGGCAVGPQLSPMQIRQITTKTIESDYETVFRSTMTILQDQGYVIKNTDMNSGLIVANVDRESSFGSQFLQAFFVGQIYDKNTVIEVSATINKINDKTQDLRINIQETNYGSRGEKQKINQIYDNKIYANIFNQILVEVKRREAYNQ